jgi:hypothetical protein
MLLPADGAVLGYTIKIERVIRARSSRATRRKLL